MANDPRSTTRRQIFQGSLVALGAIGLAGAAIAPAEASTPAPRKWDVTTDVAVVGYGGAGAVAAVTAHDKGAKVLILEKQAADKHTSNTQMCLGAILCPDSVPDAIAYMGIASRVNVDIPETQDISDAMIKAWAEASVANKAWLTSMGVKDFAVYANSGRDPRWPGNGAIKALLIKTADGRGGSGVDLFNFLDGLVRARKIEVRWSSPATRLISDGHGTIIGLLARSGGQDIAIRARRSVILTCGGFEFDAAAQRTYMATQPMVYYGNPDNTGDGIRMAQEHGADLWHMTVLGGGLKFKFADFPTAFAPNILSGGFVIVDKGGKRYKAEDQLGGYSGYWNQIVYDTVKYTWPRIPSYYVFDEKVRLTRPIVGTAYGAAGPVGMYSWSKDNSAEIARGWIKTDPTIEGLAAKIGVPPAALRAEIDAYNGYCAKGSDDEFGRAARTLGPVSAPPFYAVAAWPGLNNTFGGPRRNEKAQIVDVFGKVIGGLYSAGELGSMFVQYPQGGANIGECLAFGRIAGENAAAEKPRG